MHFPKGQAPPVNGFWSLTMYTAEYFFVDNPLNKYTVSPRNDLKYNADGSLDIYVDGNQSGEIGPHLSGVHVKGWICLSL